MTSVDARIRAELQHQVDAAGSGIRHAMAEDLEGAGELVEYTARWGRALQAVLDELDRWENARIQSVTTTTLRSVIARNLGIETP